ncbi:M28 family metallopeptidase [Pseudonocardia ailaonensis]|uniref:M28 family metallopeptidase n=1 Tax=Pseudonocardia ailaonensis TaxID=367279 RepID=A0ABN2NQD9_9PSEU
MRARMVLAGLLALVLAGCSATAPTPAPSSVPAPDQGLPARLVATASGDGAWSRLEQLQRIADDNGGTRALGRPGYDASVEYVAKSLRDKGFTVDTPTFEVRDFAVRDQRLTVGGAAVDTAVLGFSPATPAGGLRAPLHVVAQDATSGCEAEDFTGMPAGAIAVVLRGTCAFGVKSQNAARAGAGAVIVVNTDDSPLQGTLGETPGTVPTTSVTGSAGRALATRAGAPAELTLATETTQTTSRNVVAQTTTGDPGRVVMTGAHLDSVPEGPGIDDNGTGSAALLEVATALGPNPQVTNAVRFAWWGAEEVGLVGSTRYVEGLAEADRARIALYLNLDMVGGHNAGYLVYDGDDSDRQGEGPGPEGSATIERVLLEQLGTLGVQGAGTDFDGRSDYGPFIEAGIPSGGLFTGAEERKTAAQAAQWGGQAGQPFDPCYHQACDTLANVDRTALDRNVDALAGAVGRFALSLDGIPAR